MGSKKKLDFDYDASYFVNLIYEAAFFPSGVVNHSSVKNMSMIFCDGCDFRGDTMNSWSTTLNEFVRKFGEEYVQKWMEERSLKGMAVGRSFSRAG